MIDLLRSTPVSVPTSTLEGTGTGEVKACAGWGRGRGTCGVEGRARARRERAALLQRASHLAPAARRGGRPGPCPCCLPSGLGRGPCPARAGAHLPTSCGAMA
jgi:hypothetical protein